MSGLENLILNKPDSEISESAKVQDVRKLIDSQLLARANLHVSRKTVRRSVDERLTLLRTLLTASGGQHPLLQAAFSSGEKPSSDQIEAAISELMKKGSKK